MNSLSSARVKETLDKLHQDAEAADGDFIAKTMSQLEASGQTIEHMAAQLIAAERDNNRETYRAHAGHFLSISAAYGRFIYSVARACKARHIVEFGTSMGISTIYLAAALRDNGGGRLIGSELEPTKVIRARAHLQAAGLSDFVEIREGDALQTLKDVGEEIDILFVDGAWSLYLPVLRLVEPKLSAGAVILGENAFDAAYIDYVRNPSNGYISQAFPIDAGRGNEFSVRII